MASLSIGPDGRTLGANLRKLGVPITSCKFGVPADRVDGAHAPPLLQPPSSTLGNIPRVRDMVVEYARRLDLGAPSRTIRLFRLVSRG